MRKSLTATIHIVVDDELEEVRGDSSELMLVNEVMNKASGLDKDSQELLVKFADFLVDLTKAKPS